MAAIPRPQPQRPFSTAATRVLQAGHSLSPLRWCCRRTFLYRHDDGAAGGPFQTAATMVLQAGHSLPPQRWCCRRAILYRHDDGAAVIPDSGPEIKNRCTKEGISRQNPASIPKSGPEIKNHCTGKSLQRFLSSPPKIQNRCTLEGVFRQIHAVIPKLTPSNQESLQCKRRFRANTCSDSQVWA